MCGRLSVTVTSPHARYGNEKRLWGDIFTENEKFLVRYEYVTYIIHLLHLLCDYGSIAVANNVDNNNDTVVSGGYDYKLAYSPNTMTNVIFTVLIFALGMMPRELDLLMSCSSGSVIIVGVNFFSNMLFQY